MTVKCVAGRVTMADDGEFDGRGWDAAGSHRPQRFWHLPSTLTNYVYLLHPAEPDVCMDVFTVPLKRFDGPSENQVRRITYHTVDDNIRRDVLARRFALKRGTLSKVSEDSLRFRQGSRAKTRRYLGYDLSHLPSRRHDAGKLLRMFDRCECSTCRSREEWDKIVHVDSEDENYDI